MLQFSSWVETSITCEQINKGPTNPRSTSLKYRYSRVASEPALRLLMTMGTRGPWERDATSVLRTWWVRKSACDIRQPGAQRSLWVPTSQQGCKSCSAVSLIMQKCRWSDKVNTETVFCLVFFSPMWIPISIMKDPDTALNYGLLLWCGNHNKEIWNLKILSLCLGRTVLTD